MKMPSILPAIACLVLCCLSTFPFTPPAHAEKIPALSEIPAVLPVDVREQFAQRKRTLEKELAEFQAAARVFNAKDAKDQSDAEYNALDSRRTRYIAAAKEFNRDVEEARKSAVVPRTYADCGEMQAARDRLVSGLPVQEEAIRRTEAMLEAALKGIQEASAEKRQVLLEGAVNEAKAYATDVLTSAKYIRSQVDLLKALEIDKGKRELLIHSLNTVIFEGESIAKAAQAGYKGGEEMRSKADRLSRELLPQTYKMLLESGILEKAGEELSETLGGPLGALAFRGARLSIDFTVALGKGMISESERQAARKNLDVMHRQHRRAKERISELDKGLTQRCKGKP